MKKKLFGFLAYILIMSACSPGDQDQSLPVDVNTLLVSATTVVTPTPEAIGEMLSTVAVAPFETAPTMTIMPSSDFWMNLPLVPTGVSDRAREIYQRGLVMGNNSNAFSKVGDCH